jgi:lantibiotic modifying enzyme
MSPIDFGRFYIAEICRDELLSLQAQVAGIARAAQLPTGFAAPLIDGATDYLVERACRQFQKVFVAELHRHVSEAGGAEGEAAERAAFAAYVAALAGGAFAEALRQRHAFLFERAARAAALFVDFFREHIGHLAADLQRLRAQQILPDAVPERVEFGSGDPHRGGRTTIRYRFEGGREAYYKPRSMALDLLLAHAQSLITPEQPTLRSIDCGAYGWQAGVGGRPEGATAAARFYRALGESTALLQTLCGSDIHFENIVTDAEGWPYFVDVEALLTNARRCDREPQRSVPTLDAERSFDRSLADSLLSVGILSLRRTREGAFAGAAQKDKAEAPVSSETAVDARTSRMRLARVQTTMEIVSPVPGIDGAPARFADHFDRFVDGYRAAAGRIHAHADALRALLADASAVRSRQVLRHTFIYSLFLAETTHPALTGREQALRLLGKMRAEEKVKPYLARVFEHEVAQMLQFDVPYFDVGAADTALGVPGGRLDDFFEASAISQARERIEKMGDPAWLDRQVGLAATVLGMSACGCRSHAAPVRPLERLADQAFRGDDGTVIWTYSPPSDMPGAEFAIATMGADLYTGIAGVLATLARAPDADTALLRDTLETARRFSRERGHELASGGYSGFEGLLLAIAEAAIALDASEPFEDAVESLLAREDRWSPEQYDVMDGAAGLALIALVFHRRCGDPRLLALASRLGARLLDAAQETAHGLQWPLHTMRKAVTGFAHGSSGIGYALAEIGRASGEARLLDAARAALAQDDSEFNDAVGLWRDTRMDGEHYALGWCNGAAGFLLARGACWDLLDETQRGRARIAFRRSCEWFERTPDDSLCHGTAGIALALAETSATLGESVPQHVRMPAPRADRFRSGWSQDPDNLGLMVGAAGLEPAWATADPLRMHPLMLLRPSR